MILTKAYGGLGNQMFQYAVARAQSVNKDVQMAIDIAYFSEAKIHQGFELGKVFQGKFNIATDLDIRKMFGSTAIFRLQRSISRLTSPGLIKFIQEPHFEYWDGINGIPEVCYLAGYWQSERYFRDIENQIRQDFIFKPFIDMSNLLLAERIRHSKCPVSVHIRRGDMANNLKSAAFHGTCPPSYYERALSYLLQKGIAAQLFIFSDDIEWVKHNIAFSHNDVCFVSHNQGHASSQDMALMSMCHHHIIANSSFSWWGAWLNPSKNKLVIAPKEWFRKPINTIDLMPASWVRI